MLFFGLQQADLGLVGCGSKMCYCPNMIASLKGGWGEVGMVKFTTSSRHSTKKHCMLVQMYGAAGL